MRFWVEHLDEDCQVVDTTDSGIVYDKLDARAADIICGLLNAAEPEPDEEQDLVPGCPDHVREGDAHLGNSVCLGCPDVCDFCIPF